jgi:hypothetical protein
MGISAAGRAAGRPDTCGRFAEGVLRGARVRSLGAKVGGVFIADDALGAFGNGHCGGLVPLITPEPIPPLRWFAA